MAASHMQALAKADYQGRLEATFDGLVNIVVLVIKMLIICFDSIHFLLFFYWGQIAFVWIAFILVASLKKSQPATIQKLNP